MKEHPIIMDGESVRAILAGRKTQTRRVVSDGNSQGNFWASELLLDDPQTFVDPGPSPAGNPGPYLHAPLDCEAICERLGWEPGDCNPTVVERLYPRWFPGDRLWVRETWAWPNEDDVIYRADLEARELVAGWKRDPNYPQISWRSPILMPRWASRITLGVTDVRCERLWEISEEGARAEGITDGECLDCGEPEPCGCDSPMPAPVDTFARLWDAQNTKRGHPWVSNPWVWAITFEAEE